MVTKSTVLFATIVIGLVIGLLEVAIIEEEICKTVAKYENIISKLKTNQTRLMKEVKYLREKLNETLKEKEELEKRLAYYSKPVRTKLWYYRTPPFFSYEKFLKEYAKILENYIIPRQYRS